MEKSFSRHTAREHSWEGWQVWGRPFREGRRRGRVCDTHGHELELAKLRDNALVCNESTTIENTIHGTLKYAGFDSQWQNKIMFKGDTQDRSALVPDVTAAHPRVDSVYRVPLMCASIARCFMLALPLFLLCESKVSLLFVRLNHLFLISVLFLAVCECGYAVLSVPVCSYMRPDLVADACWSKLCLVSMGSGQFV